MLNKFGNVVPDGYFYYQKQVIARPNLVCPQAYFKWYDIYQPDAEISLEQREEARQFVVAESDRLQLAQEMGFVLLHQTPTVLLLMISVWRNTNEVWEAAYWKPIHTLINYQPVETENHIRPTFCVWELAPVMHERNAWTRFLSSPRDERAKFEYINDSFGGLV
jgi:hypothetical protein